MKSISRTILYLTIFSIAMGFMESAIVVYLRALYYPEGFNFPLVPLDTTILVTELLREAATLIMLLFIGIIAGKTSAQKFVFFLFCFAIWDIFYYIFLKLLIDWPASLLTWDILFLLPVPWIGPVSAPVILSITMILLTALVLYIEDRNRRVKFRVIDWILLITGSLVIIYSFTTDYLDIITNASYSASPESMMENLRNYIPGAYKWWLFTIGETIILLDFVLIYRSSFHKINVTV
jgi:hypothetical protein